MFNQLQEMKFESRGGKQFESGKNVEEMLNFGPRRQKLNEKWWKIPKELQRTTLL